MTATLLGSFEAPFKDQAGSQGSVQVLEDGNILVCLELRFSFKKLAEPVSAPGRPWTTTALCHLQARRDDSQACSVRNGVSIFPMLAESSSISYVAALPLALLESNNGHGLGSQRQTPTWCCQELDCDLSK